MKVAGAGSGESREVGAGCEMEAKVVGERADVGAFGAGDVEGEGWVGVRDEGDVDGDWDGSAFDGDAAAGEIAEFLAFDFFCGEHRRRLKDFALEGGEGLGDVGGCGDMG